MKRTIINLSAFAVGLIASACVVFAADGIHGYTKEKTASAASKSK